MCPKNLNSVSVIYQNIGKKSIMLRFQNKFASDKYLKSFSLEIEFSFLKILLYNSLLQFFLKTSETPLKLNLLLNLLNDCNNFENRILSSLATF
jgi:hypothetical protein